MKNKISSEIKIRNAKSFAKRHKNSILPLGIDEKNATYQDWMNIFEYIWQNLDSDGFGGAPYIEIRAFESKSGHAEIFELDDSELENEWLEQNC